MRNNVRFEIGSRGGGVPLGVTRTNEAQRAAKPELAAFRTCHKLYTRVIRTYAKGALHRRGRDTIEKQRSRV